MIDCADIKPTVFEMNNANPTGDGNQQQAGQHPAGQPNYWGDPNQGKAIRGVTMDVHDPANQAGNYTANGNNEPLLSNIRINFEHQATLGNNTLTSKMFTADIEKFVLQHLLYNHPVLYEKIMGVRGSYLPAHNDTAKWWAQNNTRAFRDMFC